VANSSPHLRKDRDLVRDYPQPFQGETRAILDYAAGAARSPPAPSSGTIRSSRALPETAAAKELAVLGDLSGNNYLIAKHPDLTLKRPEVSRELL
jgi:hypothetical protein